MANNKDPITARMANATTVLSDWAYRLQRNQRLLQTEEHTLSVVLLALTNMIYDQHSMGETERFNKVNIALDDLCDFVKGV